MQKIDIWKCLQDVGFFPASVGIYPDNVMAWKLLPQYWPFVRWIHWPQVDSSHKGPLMRSFDYSFVGSRNNFWKQAVKLPVIWDAMSFMRHKDKFRIPGPLLTESHGHCWIPYPRANNHIALMALVLAWKDQFRCW